MISKAWIVARKHDLEELRASTKQDSEALRASTRQDLELWGDALLERINAIPAEVVRLVRASARGSG